MSERIILTAGPAARARSEAIAARLARTSPAAALAYAEGELHRINAELQPEPPARIERPPQARGKPPRLELSSKSIKLTLVVEPAAFAAFPLPNGPDKVRFVIAVGGRRLTGLLNPKSLRKAIATVAEHGPEAVSVVVQGRLVDGDVVEEAGIVAQVKGQPSG